MKTKVNGFEATLDPEAKVMTIDLGNGAQMQMHYADDGVPALSPRRCGACSLCCRLVPVPPLDKPGGQRCQYQRHKTTGCCTVYGDDTRMPQACRMWSCRWLVDPTFPGQRPDRAHYVVDITPEILTTVAKDTGAIRNWPAVQIWVDPLHPEAHRDPRLREWIDRQAEQTGMVAIIRGGGRDEGLALAPPSLTKDGWQEQRANKRLDTNP
jgi:hypothetical protein